MSARQLGLGWPARLRGRAWRSRGLAMALALIGLAVFGEGLYIKAKASLAQILLERAWTQTLETGEPVRPWAWFDTWPVAQVRVPRLNKSVIVLNGTSGQAMAFGPGLMTAGPPPGVPGLSILSAHRDTHFRFLKDLAIGDEIIVETADQAVHTFRVFDMRVVEANQSGLSFEQDDVLLALTTCWPFNELQSGRKRFVAIARRVSQSG